MILKEKLLADQINVICLFCGSGYELTYVKILNNAIGRKLSMPFKFTVFTDNNNLKSEFENVIILPEFNYKKLWWYKLWLFSEDSGLSGTTLYFDLDVVILKQIDIFVAKNSNLHILRDFNRVNHHKINLSNSSIMSWGHENYRYLWHLFNSNQQNYVNKMHGDQDFIHAHAKNKVWYDDALTSSYKWEYQKKKNYGPATRAIVFHGKPKPHEVQDDIIKANWCTY